MGLASHLCACNLGVSLQAERAVADALVELGLALGSAATNDTVARVRALVVEALFGQGTIVIDLTFIWEKY